MVVLVWFGALIAVAVILGFVVGRTTAAMNAPLRRRFGFDHQTVAMIVVIGLMTVVLVVLVVTKLLTS